MPPVGAVERLPLFVFGTLRLGHENHHYLEGRYEQMLAASLHGYARLHPLMIARHSDGVVDGELYFLDDVKYEATLAGCDELEEIPLRQLVGRDYERRRVTVTTVSGPFEAWAYVQPEPSLA
jgi:gamma-glutamylcyclotransferase (GGCT)/AIG2-like uncharacterized protein YtfP